MYALKHPEFLRELEALGDGGRDAAASPQTPAPALGLSRLSLGNLNKQFNALTQQPASKPAEQPAAEPKLALWVSGRYDFEDPAAKEPPVLNWVREERRVRDERAAVREVRRLRRQLYASQEQGTEPAGAAEQQPELSQSYDLEDDERRVADYDMHASTLSAWEQADRARRRPLSRKAPRAVLLTGDKRTHAPCAGVPVAWLLTANEGAGQAVDPEKAANRLRMRLRWRLPAIALSSL